MQKLKHISPLSLFVMFFVILSGIIGCDNDSNNPTANGTVVRTGQTPGGTPFTVIQEPDEQGLEVLKVQIGDREAVEIERSSYRMTVIDSIQVDDLMGNFSFFHISWQDNWYNLYTALNHHYLIVAEADPTLIVLKQKCPFDFDGHYVFSWKRGKHSITYVGDTLDIVEHWKTCEGSGCGASGSYGLKERQLARSYRIDAFGTDVTLQACEERYRELTSTSGPPTRSLEPPLSGEWTLTDLSANDILTKCRAIDHAY